MNYYEREVDCATILAILNSSIPDWFCFVRPYFSVCQWPYNLTPVCVSNTNLASCSPDLLHIGRFVAVNPRSPPKHVMTMVNKVVQIKQQNMNVFSMAYRHIFQSGAPIYIICFSFLQHCCKINQWYDAPVVLFSHQPWPPFYCMKVSSDVCSRHKPVGCPCMQHIMNRIYA